MPRNISEFRIIGQVGGVDPRDNVTFVNLAANYNRKDGDEWITDTHWNRVTCFGRSAEQAAKAGKGDMVHVTGRVRQSQYEKDGETVYGVDLIADSFSVLARQDEVEA